MTRKCRTGKVKYPSRFEAKEALLYLHANQANPGPKSFYLCEVCEEYHLTSQGDLDTSVTSAQSDRLLQRRTEADYWERKLK